MSKTKELNSFRSNRVTVNGNRWLDWRSCLPPVDYFSCSAQTSGVVTAAQLSVGDMIIYQMSSEMAGVSQPGVRGKEKEKPPIFSPDKPGAYALSTAFSYFSPGLPHDPIHPPSPFPLPSALQRQSAAPVRQQGRPTGRVFHADRMPFLKPMQSQQK